MDLHDLIWWFAGLAPGLLLGWWLGARKRPATTQAVAPAPPSPPQPKLPPEPRPEPKPTPAIAQSAPAIVAPAAPAQQTAAAPAPEPPAVPAVPAWSPEVQALFDKGETIEAIKKIRSTLGGPVARKVAREHLSDGEFRLPADIRKLADANKKLEAIRLLCDHTHMDMPLAQRLVEHYVAHPYR